MKNDDYSNNNSGRDFPVKKIIVLVFVAIIAIIVLFSLHSIGQNVAADEIVVVQAPFSGKLTFHFAPGLKWQGFGKVTIYHKESQYWFSRQKDQGKLLDQSIKIRFNDGGHATLSGSVRWKLPLNVEGMTKVHTLYGSQEAVEQALIRTVFEKAVYMTGPLMSSKESYAEKRNDLIFYVNDQAEKGVYRTKTKETKGVDLLSGKEKTISVVELVIDPSTGETLRQEISPFSTYSILTYNLSINEVKYDTIVEQQIVSQQKAIMDVQTAIALSKTAEQDAIKAEEQGKALAAKAKWEQEVIKAQAVTEAQQKKEVADLDMQAARFTKEKEILLGQGEATRKKLVIEADGALAQKLLTYENVQKYWADAFSKYTGNIVPMLQSGVGTNGTGGSNGVNEFMQIMSAQAAKNLSLDLSVKK
jgi:hypothetical protein